MKKRYIIPQTDVVVLNISNHLCLGSNDGISESVVTTETVDNDGELLSRKGFFWDEDEDE